MKKHLFLLILSCISCLLLVACSEEKIDVEQVAQGNELEYVASVEDFEDVIFRNDEDQFISFNGDKVEILATLSHRRKTDIDTILEKEANDNNESYKKDYTNVQVTVEGSKYHVKLTDELSLEFEKIGERIIKDSQGVRYYAQNKH